jgi:hypothetical protein
VQVQNKTGKHIDFCVVIYRSPHYEEALLLDPNAKAHIFSWSQTGLPRFQVKCNFAKGSLLSSTNYYTCEGIS